MNTCLCFKPVQMNVHTITLSFVFLGSCILERRIATKDQTLQYYACDIKCFKKKDELSTACSPCFFYYSDIFCYTPTVERSFSARQRLKIHRKEP